MRQVLPGLQAATAPYKACEGTVVGLEVPVLDRGFVCLEDSVGGDLAVVNAARVSFAQRSDEMADADRGLISYLLRNRHGTPFEHATMTFRIKCPLFVAREWMRHRVGSYNEWSQRYSEILPEFYVPALEHCRTQVGKPGAYEFARLPELEAAECVRLFQEAQSWAFEAYREMLEMGVAKELASRVLPVSVYTQFVWTVNARSLMNFLELRTSEHAQFEIRQFALAVNDLWGELMPATYAAFDEAGRTAP